MAKELVKAPESLSVWMSNMKELVARQPGLGAVLHAYVEKHGHSFEHFETKTPSGKWIEGFSDEPFFQSDEDPKVDWDKKSRDVPVFFQYGIGTPPYLFKVIRTLPAEALSLIVVEPNVELLAYVLHMTHVYRAMPRGASLTFVTQPKETPKNMKLVKSDCDPNFNGEDVSLEILSRAIRDEALSLGLNIHGLFTALLSRAATHQGEEQAFRDDLAKIAANIREWLVLRLNNLGNSSHDTMLGLRQMALMSPWIVYGYPFESLLKDFNERPFVVVSAGPSLDKNFELLRDIRDKSVILANDAVLNKMLASGILPHVVCVLERGLETYDLLFRDTVRNYPEECSKILLIAQAVCTPKIFGTWPGPKIIVGKSEIPVDRWFLGDLIQGTLINSGSSVAHMCLGVALTMGASSVALIGQDLAYGEGGVSHVAGVFGQEEMEKQRKKEGEKGIYKIPGSMGGEVETSELWLAFLRLFEERINATSVPVFDCTEGGALIKGAMTRAFSDYIANEVLPLDDLDATPTQKVLQNGAVADKKNRFDAIAPLFEKASNDLDEIEKIIGELIDRIDKVSSAAILPEKRVRYASDAAVLMDNLNRLNPMFAFIAQSYLYLSSTEIAVTRFLDSVEVVERWVTVHKEIVEADIAILVFIREWLSYTKMALEYYVEKELPLTPFSDEGSYEVFTTICDELGDGRDQIKLRMEMDALLAFVDPVLADWPGNALWQSAKFLFEESRSEEAGQLIKAAADYFEDMELPVDEIYSFFKDYARIMMTSDLCYLPNYDFAKLILDNAVGLCGVDEEIAEMRETLSERRASLYTDLYTSKGIGFRRHIEAWFRAKERAEKALASGDAMRAMEIVWDAVRSVGKYIPNLAAPHLIWLFQNMEKFFDAQDECYKTTINSLLDDIASRMDVLRDIPIPYTAKFIQALAEHGANVSFPSMVEEQQKMKT